MGFATIDPVRLLKRYYPWLVIAAVVGAVVGAAAHFILALTFPFYTSTATFMCKPQVTDVRAFTASGASIDDFIRFIGTQTAYMTSSRTQFGPPSSVQYRAISAFELPFSSAMTREAREGVDDPALEAVLCEIDLRAAVELAKLDRAR